jgi:hypothetical protein
LGGALFINLRKVFVNLVEVNGKDYSSFLHARKEKRYSMKKILSKAHKIERQLTKTLKTTANTKYNPVETASNHGYI